MLVEYSSSSEDETQAEEEKKRRRRRCGEEDDAEDGHSARKKPKTEQEMTKSRLPVPRCLLSMFPDEVDPQTEDRSLHGGRIRSFKHERGNWATYVYLPYHPAEDLEEVLDQLLSVANTHGLALTPQEQFHISLSQTVVLRHHWIQPFTQSLKTALARCQRFSCAAGKLKAYCNAERTRTFLGMEVCTGHAQLKDLIQVVDRTMTEFHLDTFYKDPSFHVSLAWCTGDVTEQVEERLQELQTVVDERDEGPLVLTLDCVELRCRTGNKCFRFPLES